MDAVSVVTSRLLFPAHRAASGSSFLTNDAVDVAMDHQASMVSEVITEKEQQSHATAYAEVPPGWNKLTDDYGVTYYVQPSTGTFQYTHPSLNAPPFAPTLTDYVMGHPAFNAQAWAWMLYFWVREVKSSHSVIGTLCAVTLCGRNLCAPPRDKLFQRRVTFRIYFMISSLLSSLLMQAAFMVMMYASISQRSFALKFQRIKPSANAKGTEHVWL